MTKYRSIKTTVAGIEFDSRAEAARYTDLLLLQRAGKISGLTRQVPFVLAPPVKLHGETRTRPAIRYVADFVFSDPTEGVIVLDVKGMDTPMSRLKRHLMATVLGIQVRIVK